MLVVVAFHAHLPVPGGFVGVDIFFVISGFVITAMLHREWCLRGRIRFARFYVRRFKRLTPALAVTVALTVVGAALVLSPLGPQQETAKTAIGALLLAANVVIARTTGQYFDAPAEDNPLLNMWSLSVEEQFYLGFPLVLAVSWYLGRRFRATMASPVAAVAIVGAVSFGLMLLDSAGAFGEDGSPALGFYSPITRAWEFAAGALLALLLTRVSPRPPRIALALAGLGAVLVAVSLWLIDGGTPFPSVWTVLPVVGALLVLLGGGLSTNPVSAVLATRPMVLIGDWSYSIYLWHWPLIVLATAVWPHAQHVAVVAAAVSFVPAVASYYWLEQPIRALSITRGPKLAALIAATLVPPLALAGALWWSATAYWTPRYESGQIPVAFQGDIGQTDFHRYVQAGSTPCTPESIREHAPTWEDMVRCYQSKPGTDVDIALVGDSHAEHLFPGLAAALPDLNVAYYIVGDAPTRQNADFARILDAISASKTITGVILSARWDTRGVPTEGLKDTLETLRGDGSRVVFVTDDVPVFPFDPFRCKFSAPLLAPPQCSMEAERFWAVRDSFSGPLEEVVRAVPGVELVDIGKFLCSEQTCDMTRGHELLYRDPNHLNLNGSRYVAARMLAENPRMADALSGRARR